MGFIAKLRSRSRSRSRARSGTGAGTGTGTEQAATTGSRPGEFTRGLLAARPPQGADLQGGRALAAIQERLVGGRRTNVELGRYQILEPLGSGGMGVVHRAYDPELDRPIAIKFVRPGACARERTRLVREAQALARLTDARVVRVYDVGEFTGLADLGLTEGGVYIVMELAEGPTLRHWLSNHPRSWREVLAVYLQAAHGLAAAHASGLVHRDFKPDNVVLTTRGAKVLDFGLALASSPSAVAPAAEETLPGPVRGQPSGPLEVTDPGIVAGTPAYMSPEQHVGGTADARSDQFSFCLALYEALTGARPYAGHSGDTLAQAKIDGRIAKAWPASVPRGVRRALLRGLDPDPGARWPSMAALCDALQRTPRRGRHAAAALVMGGLAVGAVVATAGTDGQATCGRLVARANAVWSPANQDAVRSALERSELPYAGSAAARVVTELDAYIGAFGSAADEVCAAHGGDSPAVRCLERRLDEFEALQEALVDAGPRALDRAGTAAAALGAARHCRDPQAAAMHALPRDPARAAQVEAVRRGLARISAMDRAAQFEPGLALAQALASAARTSEYLPVQAEALRWRGYFEHRAGQFDAARETLADAVYTATAGGADWVTTIASIDLIGVATDAADFEDARAWARHADAALLRWGHGGPYHARLSMSVASLDRAQGRYADARRRYGSAIELLQAHYGAPHPDAATALNNWGSVALNEGRETEALQRYREAEQILTEILGEAHPHTAGAGLNVAIALQSVGQVDSARREFARVLKIFENTVGPHDVVVGYALTNLGHLEGDEGNHRLALEHMTAAAAIFADTLPAQHPATATVAFNMGAQRQALGELGAARRDHERALGVATRALSPDHPLVAMIRCGIARIDIGQGRYDAAIAHAEAARTSLAEAKQGADPMRHAEALFVLARAISRDGSPTVEALELARFAQGLVLAADPGAGELDTIDAFIRRAR